MVEEDNNRLCTLNIVHCCDCINLNNIIIINNNYVWRKLLQYTHTATSWCTVMYACTVMVLPHPEWLLRKINLH